MEKRTEVLISLWDRLMILQTDFSLPSELIFYYNSKEWMNANTIVDLGSGNGYYLKCLAKLFPEKKYLGIDHENAYIDLANKYPKKKIRFEHRDLIEVEGIYDLVIARLLVQHLASIEEFLIHVHNILPHGGTLLIIDSNDSMRNFEPQLEKIKEFFDKFRESRLKDGCDRDAGMSMSNLSSKYGFDIVRQSEIVLSSTIGENKKIFYESYKTVFEIIKKEFKVDFDYNSLKAELKKWFKNPISYGQIGVHMALYQKA